MLDDNKRSERVPVNLTERELVDACREGARMDKKPAEIIRYALRLYLYGTVGSCKPEGQETNRSD